MTDKDDKVRAIPTAPDKVAGLLEQAEREWPREVKLAAYMARLMKARFDALKKEGFSAEQALELTKHWMSSKL